MVRSAAQIEVVLSTELFAQGDFTDDPFVEFLGYTEVVLTVGFEHLALLAVRSGRGDTVDRPSSGNLARPAYVFSEDHDAGCGVNQSTWSNFNPSILAMRYDSHGCMRCVMIFVAMSLMGLDWATVDPGGDQRGVELDSVEANPRVPRVFE